MISIAREILLHDKVRLGITVVSLAFAIVMIVYNLGMFFGTLYESVSLIDHAHADLWVVEESHRDIYSPSLLPLSAIRWARRAPGVAQACGLNLLSGNLLIQDNHPVMVVAIDPDCALLQPWDLRLGEAANLRRRDAIIVDDYTLRDDPTHLGDTVELNGRELQVVAVSHNNKSFTTPYAYVSRQTFASLGGDEDGFNYVMVQLAPLADPGQAMRGLASGYDDLAVFPAGEFRRASMLALVSQGLGVIFVVVAVGVLVGLLIITMTIYTATMERLRDFAVLKAIGATRRKILGIVLEQAVAETLLGFGTGLAASLGLNYAVENTAGLRGSFPAAAILVALVTMLVLAMLGSLISVRKAVSVDPTVVFRA
jgi:putative ABC transport system permease protein